LGDMGCFSFYPGKNLGAYGEGGMVVTNNPDYAHTIRLLRDWGAEQKYMHVLKGYNYRMEGLQGAILRVKLRHLPTWTEARRAHAKCYHELLTGLTLTLPREMPNRKHVYHIYGIQTERRSAIQQTLRERGISTGIHYPAPLHLLPAYNDFGYVRGNFPVSEQVADRQLSLPMFAELTAEQQNQVAKALRAVDEDKLSSLDFLYR
ncbi:MAG: DegT/DnrJ/EryC1/StrS family aminotransferase, partial [Chloroflexota bacterium]